MRPNPTRFLSALLLLVLATVFPAAGSEISKTSEPNLVLQKQALRMAQAATGVAANHAGLLANHADVTNQFVNVTVACELVPGNRCEGNFGMGTTGGNPADPYDDGKPLIFGWPIYRGTTFTSVWIDGHKMKYGETGIGGGTIVYPPTINEANSSASMLWRFNRIDIEQRITLVNNLSDRADTAEISYFLTNTGSSTSDVGVRVLLDLQIGNNDGAPINVVGFPYSEFEQDFVAPNIPQYWQAFENTVSNPGTIAQGTLYGVNATIPDRFVVAYWINIAGMSQEIWDYTVNPTQSYIHPTGSSTDPDSAVAIWWNPRDIQPGQTIRFTTYYGLGTGSTCENDLSVNFSAPATLPVVDCQYSPNPFDASLVMMNLTAFTATNVRATLMLPAGLQFVSPSTSVLPIGDLASNAQANGSWRIFADGTVTGTLTMHLRVESDTTAICELERGIFLQVADCTPTPIPTPTLVPVHQPPRLLIGGYMESRLKANSSSPAKLVVLALDPDGDIERVGLGFGGNPTGLFLADDGFSGDFGAGDGFYGFLSKVTFPARMRMLLNVQAIDRQGLQSALWPYLEVSP